MISEIDAATVIQEAWLMHYYSDDLRTLSRIGFRPSGVLNTDFKEVRKLLMNSQARKTALELTCKLKASLPPVLRPEGSGNQGNIFLSAYMITSDEGMLSTGRVCAKDALMSEKASALVSSLQRLQKSVMGGCRHGFVRDLRALSVAWAKFHKVFVEWKASDSRKNVEELRKCKNEIGQMYLSTAQHDETTRAWHGELRKYEKKVNRYYEIFSSGLQTTPEAKQRKDQGNLGVSAFSDREIIHEILMNDSLKFDAAYVGLDGMIRKCAVDLSNGNFDSANIRTIIKIIITNVESLITLEKVDLVAGMHPEALKVRELLSLPKDRGISGDIRHNIMLFIPILESVSGIMTSLGYKRDPEADLNKIKQPREPLPENVIPHIERCLKDIVMRSTLCKVDSLNCTVNTIRTRLTDEFARKERLEFEKSIKFDGSSVGTLPCTLRFMKNCASLVPLNISTTPDVFLWRTFCDMITSLIFCLTPVVESLSPETLRLDTKRINRLQVNSQCIAITSSLLLLVKYKYGVSQAARESLKTKLIAMFSFKEDDYFGLNPDTTLSIRNIELCLASAITSDTPNSPLTEPLTADIKSTISLNSPILKLFLSRLKDLCSKSLQANSLDSTLISTYIRSNLLLKEIKQFLNEILTLAERNFYIYAPYYKDILKEIYPLQSHTTLPSPRTRPEPSRKRNFDV